MAADLARHTAPGPASYNDFMRELRRILRMPLGMPSPGWVVRLGAPLIMRPDPELALYGRFCISRRVEEEGFEFMFPDLTSALEHLFSPPEGAET